MIDRPMAELPALLHLGFLGAAPLLWAGLGGVLSERSGVINIGLEGMMLMGAFLGVLGSYYAGTPWAGLALGLAGGAALGWLHAWIGLYWRADQIVSGMGINLLSLGLTGFMLSHIFQTKGNSPEAPRVPMIQGLGFEIPFLTDTLFPMSVMHVLLAVAALSTAYLLARTPIGLRLRACGEDPRAARAAGIRVNRIRYAAVTAGGMLAGAGGAQLSIGDISQFGAGMTDGRGFIALAAVICAGWRPGRLVAVCLLFGVFEALGERLQVAWPGAPPRLFLALPFLLVLLVLAVRAAPARAPQSLGDSTL